MFRVVGYHTLQPATGVDADNAGILYCLWLIYNSGFLDPFIDGVGLTQLRHLTSSDVQVPSCLRWTNETLQGRLCVMSDVWM